MLRKAECRLGSALDNLLGRTTFGHRPRYLQQASVKQKVFLPGELQRVARKAPSLQRSLKVALADMDASDSLWGREGQLVPLEESSKQDGLTPTAVPCIEASETLQHDDDVVVEAFEVVSGSGEAATLANASSQVLNVQHEDVTPSFLIAPSSSPKVSADVLDMVTDEFKTARDREVKRRRQILYDLTHPCPTDYTYQGKLLPPPPLSFGQVSPQSIDLGNKVMLGQHYSLVKSAPSSDYFFEINDLYMEIVFAGKANAGKSSLINALLGQERLAKTSSTPNSTREVKFYQSATPDELAAFANRNPNKLVKLPAGGLQLTFVDLPGFGISGMSDKWRDNAIACTDAYLGTRRSVNTVFLCIDVDAGLTKADITYMEWLENLHGVFWVLLTKCDAVPHSRVCSVMRQVYELITKHRTRYRKAFPFVLPVSAHDGTNVDVLRGLIAETSGLIPGDRLREILRAKAKQNVDEASRLEEKKLWDMWHAERQRRFPQPRPSETAQRAPPLLPGPKPRSMSLRVDGYPTAAPPPSEPKEKVTLPYGGKHVKLNDGLQHEAARKVDLTWGADATPESNLDTSDSSTPATTMPCGGAVSRYLDTLDAMARASQPVRRRLVSKRSFEHRASVVEETQDGRLRESVGGRQVGSLLLQPSSADSRASKIQGGAASSTEALAKSQWQARKYAALATEAAPTAPWSALTTLKKKEEHLRQQAAVSKMSKKDLDAYLKRRGSVVDGFEKFENAVKTAKYQRESRNVETLRKQAQLELNGEDRISYSAQPPGLFKAYGQQSSYWPTSSVLGV